MQKTAFAKHVERELCKKERNVNDWDFGMSFL
jgi:hypothetical protein